MFSSISGIFESDEDEIEPIFNLNKYFKENE